MRLPDSRNHGRTLAAIGLTVGPLLFLADALIDPAWAKDDAEYLMEVAGNEFRFVAGEIASTLGALFFVAGMLGVVRLTRDRRVTLGQLAAGLVTVGLIGLTASFAFSVFDLAMANFDDRAAMVELRGELEESAAFRAYWLVFFRLGVILGLVLLAVALQRMRLVPLWSSSVLVVAAMLWWLGNDERTLHALSSVLLAVALLPLAVRVASPGDRGARPQLS